MRLVAFAGSLLPQCTVPAGSLLPQYKVPTGWLLPQCTVPAGRHMSRLPGTLLVLLRLLSRLPGRLLGRPPSSLQAQSLLFISECISFSPAHEDVKTTLCCLKLFPKPIYGVLDCRIISSKWKLPDDLVECLL